MTRLQVTSHSSREAALAEVRRRLEERSQTLPAAIDVRDLYFRVSVVGACNLSCTFGHNEGAPTHGRISHEVIEGAVDAAVAVGFSRVQFTGGEPLLHPDLHDFIRIARRCIDDVGVTTNGTYLPKRLAEMEGAGLKRLHVSLQTESLNDGDSAQEWTTPLWLMPTVERAASGAFRLRLNLPVPADSLPRAERFLAPLTQRGISIKVFSILPEGAATSDSYPADELAALVERVNLGNQCNKGAGVVELRGYRPPSGHRCMTCKDRPRCKEQSHSLRLGADLVLRPCLATREWDMPIDWPMQPEELKGLVQEQALLALDYQW